jgi:hypothetical protein
MNLAPLNLEAGAHVSTTFDHGRESIHAIVARKLDAHCESGVMYRVLPDLGGWIDAHWFKRVSGFEHADFDPDDDMDPFEEFGTP